MPKVQTPIKWNHYLYEYWEQRMDEYYTKIEDHGTRGGYNVNIGIDSSARGANCMEGEIDGLIGALQAAKKQVAELRAAALQDNKGVEDES